MAKPLSITTIDHAAAPVPSIVVIEDLDATEKWPSERPALWESGA